MDSSMEEIGSSTDGATSPPIQQANHTLSVSLMMTDFAAYLESVLDTDETSDSKFASHLESQSDQMNDAEFAAYSATKTTRRKIEQVVVISPGSTSQGTNSGTGCTHPGEYKGLCVKCGKVINHYGVPVAYIQEGYSLSRDEMDKLSNKNLLKLFGSKRLFLVLGLDHTLIDSTRAADITPEEQYITYKTDYGPEGSVYRLEFFNMYTKLRPFVRKFLKEANELFDMYVCTLGKRKCALEIVKWLDPADIYFKTKVISREDCTLATQKSLDVMLLKKAATIIVDDTPEVWKHHTENLIVIKRYLYFASSLRQFGLSGKSLCEEKTDDSGAEGALAKVLEVLKQIHEMFYDKDHQISAEERDVTEVVQGLGKQVLNGCNLVFSLDSESETEHMREMAKKLGATCLRNLDPSVTHAVSTNREKHISRWALETNKHLVNPEWIETASYTCQRPSEANFPVQ